MKRFNNLYKVKYIIKYILYIFLILIFSFILPRIIPGSPLSLNDSDTYILNHYLPEETFNLFKDYYSPNDPLYIQFLTFMKHIIKFDFGYSFHFKMPVLSLILGRIPWTLFLSMVSLLISVIIAIPLAIKDSLKCRIFRFKLIFFICLQSIPTFLIGLIVQLIFSYRLRWFPSGGAYTVGITFFTIDFFIDALKHLFLPLFTLIIGGISSLYIIAYNSTQKIIKENYTIMAVYLNINEKDIKKKFIFYNIIPEILGKLNIQFIYCITGSIFIESIFSYPGMGQLLKIAATSRDYPLMQGILLIISFYSLFINFIFEFLSKKFRMRY